MVRTTPGTPIGWSEVGWGWLPWTWPVEPADLIISGTPAEAMPLPPSGSISRSSVLISAKEHYPHSLTGRHNPERPTVSHY